MNPHVIAFVQADQEFVRLEEKRNQVLAQRRVAALDATADGVTRTELAEAAGIGRQRVSKIIDGNAPPRRRRRPPVPVEL